MKREKTSKEKKIDREKKSGREKMNFFLFNTQKVPATLLQCPPESKQPKHKLIEHHISSSQLRHREAADWLPQGQREEQETSHYEWLDFFSSSRLKLVAKKGIQSRTLPIE